MTVKRSNAGKPRVVSLGRPAFIGQEYLDEFSKAFDFSILEARDRSETQQLLPLDIAKNGPIDAFIIRMGTPPFEPFDEDLLRALAPNCQIITSASAGYNEFDVDWMTRSGIYFCNTVDAVAEATADMAIFLMLATLRNTCNAERSMKNGTWRGGVTPTKDPSGLTLGIFGMGAIGKVSRMGRVDAKHIPDACPVPCEESTRFQHEDQVL
jgi:lactate dehydrogenase-like 2-hydroxyacid dehydrogenase